MPYVEGPEGLIEFPDGMAQADMERAMREKYPPPTQQVPQPTTDSTLGHMVGQVGKGLLGFTQSAFGSTEADKVEPGQVATKPMLRTPEGTLMPYDSQTSPITPQMERGGYKVEHVPLEQAQSPIEKLQAAIPSKPELEDSFWATKVPHGVGNAVGFMAGIAAGRIAGFGHMVPTFLLGGLTSAHETEKELRRAGVEDTALPTGIAGAVGGATAILPFGTLFGPLDKVSGGALRKAMIRGGTTALTMAAMNAIQTPVGNLIAKEWYDKNRDTWEGLVPSIAEGLAVGGIVGAGHGLFSGRSTTKSAEQLGVRPDEFRSYEDWRSQAAGTAGAEANDTAVDRMQEAYGKTQADREIARQWEQYLRETEEPPAQENSQGSIAEELTPSPVYTPEGDDIPAARRSALGGLPENIQEAPKAPSVEHPVQDVIRSSFMDPEIAAHSAKAYGKFFGVRFYPWKLSDGRIVLRLGPQPGAAVSEPVVEQRPTSPWDDQAVRLVDTLRAVEAQRRGEHEARTQETISKANAPTPDSEVPFQQRRIGSPVSLDVLRERAKLRPEPISEEEQRRGAREIEDQQFAEWEKRARLGQAPKWEASKGVGEGEVGETKPTEPEATKKSLVEMRTEADEQILAEKVAKAQDAEVPVVGAKATRDVTEDFVKSGRRVEAPVAKPIEQRLGGPEVLKGGFRSEAAAKLQAKRLGGRLEVVKNKEGTFDVVKFFSFGSPEMFREVFGTEKLPEGSVFSALTRLYKRYAGTPQHWGPQKAVDIAEQGRQKFSMWYDGAIKKVEGWLHMGEQDRADAKSMIMVMDREGSVVPTRNIEYEGGQAKVSEQHYREMQGWLAGKNITPKAQEMVLAFRRGLDEAFVHRYNFLRSLGPLVDPNVLEEMRQHTGNIAGYFPHMWYGSHYVEGVDKDGKVVARVPFDPSLLQKGLGRANSPVAEAIKNDPTLAKLGIVEWSKPKSASALERYWMNSPVPLDTMMRLLDESAKRLEANPELSELAAAYRKIIPKEVGEILKTRGFGNFAKREGMLGYERDNIMKVYADYMHGSYGSIARLEKVRAYTEMLADSKLGPEEYKDLKTFIEGDLSPVGDLEKAADVVRGVAYVRFFFGKIAPGLKHLSNRITTDIPVLRLYTDGAFGALNKASVDSIPYLLGKEAKGLTPVEKRLLDEAKSRGITNSQLTSELSSQMRDDFGWQWRLMRVVGMPISIAEQFMRTNMVLAAARQFSEGRVVREKTLEQYGLEKGRAYPLEVEENYLKALDFASRLSNEAHRVYAKYNKPALAQGALGRSFYTFKGFSHHLMDLWTKMATQEGWRGKQSAAISILGHYGLMGVVGVPIVSSLMQFYRSLTGDDPEALLRNKLPESETLRDMVFEGVPSVAGIYLGSSHFDLPSSIADLLGPGAQTAEDVVRAWNAYNGDNPGRAAEILAPLIILRNIMQGYREGTEGVSTIGGRPIGDASGQQRVLSTQGMLTQMAGLRPTESEKYSRLGEAERALSERVRVEREHIADRYHMAIVGGDADRLTKVLDELVAWNLRAIEREQYDQVITKQSLDSALRSRMQPRSARGAAKLGTMQRSEAYGLR